MTRFTRRWACLLAVLLAAPVFAQRPSPGAEEPNQDTLRRLAEQLGAGGGAGPQMPNISPELMKMAAELLRKNPDIVNDPAFQKQVQQYQQQAQKDPQGFQQKLREQGLTQDRIKELQDKFREGNAGRTPQLPPVRPQTGPQPAPMPPQQGNPQPGPTPSPTPPGVGAIPGQPPEPSAAEKAVEKKDYQQVVGWWENSFGSIDNTPALKQSLIDMFSGEGKSPFEGSGSGLNGPGKNGTSLAKPWWDLSGGGSNPNGQSGFTNWLKNTTANPPSWWKNFTSGASAKPPNPGSGWTPPAASGGFGGGGGIGVAGVGGAAVPMFVLVLLVVAAVLAFVVYRYWPQIQALRNGPKPLPGLGPWTIDPREVKDRETLVRAFEYLSVHICGDGARVWNHQTIADAFRQNVPGAAPFADPLARLYALARYSPANEPIDPADIAEARGYLCRLAGVRE